MSKTNFGTLVVVKDRLFIRSTGEYAEKGASVRIDDDKVEKLIELGLVDFAEKQATVKIEETLKEK
jgi:hypothetical protein